MRALARKIREKRKGTDAVKVLDGEASSIARRKQRLYLAIAAIAVVAIVVDLAIIASYIHSNNKRQALISSQESQLGSQNVPSSKKPTKQQVNNYEVPPTLPKYLVIPSIDVDARVDSLGTSPKNQIDAPDNIYDVGWYNGSALPGAKGAMFIDGHVSSWTADGVFYNLNKLKPGDVIKVIRGDNTTYTYTVQTSQVYSANSVPMNKVLAPIGSSVPGLNLMTCTGHVIKGTSEFNERLVVYASLSS